MVLMRGLLAVIIGAAVMWAASMAVAHRLFAEGQPAPEPRVIVMGLLGLALGAAIGGFLCTLIAGSANSPAVYVAIGVMVFFAGRAVVLHLGVEPDWYRLVSTIALAGGFLIGASTAAYKMDRR
jgi:hypothetical protein